MNEINLIASMDIRHLRMVDAVAELGNLSAAASKLCLTQSALSHQLKRMENITGLPLFLRQGKRMLLTQAGQRLLESANNILNELDAAQRDIQAMAAGDKGRIRLSTECYTCYHWLPRVIPIFHQSYPDVDIDIDVDAMDDIPAALEARQLEFGIISCGTNQKPGWDLPHYSLFVDDLVVLVSPKHPLAKETAISMTALNNEHLILYTRAKAKFLRLLQHFGPAEPKKVTCLQLTEAILEWVSANIGVTIIARWAAQRYIESGAVVAVGLDNPALRREWFAVVAEPDEALIPKYMQTFIQLLHQHPPVGMRVY
jgi:LysR family transcriptional regulator for metE and metH